MLKYKPKRYIKSAAIAVTVMLAVLVCLAVIGALGIGNDLLNQSLVFAVVAGIVYILMRYAIYEYTYTLSENELAVTKIAGRIPNTVLCIGISKGDKFIRVSGKKELRALGVKKIENACANLSPRERMYAYITMVANKKTAILFEADELFAFAVNERINLKKMTEKDTETEKGEL